MKTVWKHMENQWKPMKTYGKRMKTHENLWQTYENTKVWVVLLYITRREAPRRKNEWGYCVLRGAKRHGEKMSGFTVYYAVRSAAAKILMVSLCITRREAPRRKFEHFFLGINISAADGASDN